MTLSSEQRDMRKHNVCQCACEPCASGRHCRGEFCKSTVPR